MIFWRKKGKSTDPDPSQTLLHPPGEPQIEPGPQDEPDPAGLASQAAVSDLVEAGEGILSDLDEVPTPRHSTLEDAYEARDLSGDAEGGGWFSRLTRGLSKSSTRIGTGLSDLFTKSRLDLKKIESLEDALIEADLGPATAAKVVAEFSNRKFDSAATDAQVRVALAEDLCAVLEKSAHPLAFRKPEKGPFVILVCGVNGVGKTTTIGKLAYLFHIARHKKVVIAAADTFRAAAIEQLQVWAARAMCPVVAQEVGADAASVAFEAYAKAAEGGADILIVDTAGRLHNKANLMAELEKIVRVLRKHDPAIPHQTLLILDATTGQNAFAQVETFRSMIDVTGLVVTKLDGSARAGVVVGLADRFGLPIHAVGVGEGIEDLQPFRPHAFARALVGLEEGEL
jgi:fused signal recognition particle receptor